MTLTRPEQHLRLAAALLALVSAGFAGIYLLIGVLEDAEYPYAVNSVAKDFLLVGLSLLVVWDVRRWAGVAVPLIAAVHVLMPAILLLTLIGDGESTDSTWGAVAALPLGSLLGGDDSTVFRWSWLAADVVVAAIFVLLHARAIRARYDVRYLTPAGFRALMALAEVLVLHEDRDVAPADVARRADHYLAGFRAREKPQIKLAFVALAYLPLVTLRPPFHMMSPDLRRRWVQRRFLDESRDWLVPSFVRELRRAMIRAAQQFCFMGYYGDAGAAERVGYLPYSRRTVAEDMGNGHPPAAASRGRVQCLAPQEIVGERLSAQIVVVGTGAAGATLAHQLAACGREVLLLERGLHVEPQAFTEDEAAQLSMLYGDGALTMAKNFRFQVAQGMCVGGSTVVNNAVCFDLPDPVRDRWLGPELEMGLEAQRLGDAFRFVRQFLQVGPIEPAAQRNPGAEHLVAAIHRHASEELGGSLDLVDCNIAGCRGTGYCNIGCPFGAKLSALDWTLPQAQARYPGRVQVLADCRVERVLMRGSRARGVSARLGDGRRLTIAADTVVLSAGAIASSVILQRSGLGGKAVGRSLSFNIASPVTIDFDEPVHSERGAQISHYFRPHDPDDQRFAGFTLETWFNPVVTQSLFMPGWFEEHRRNMQRYAYMTCLGAVVGTESNGSVQATRTGAGVRLRYRPTDRDFVALKRGVRLACAIGLEAGARRVLPATFHQLEITSPRDLGRIDDEIGDDAELSINSSHPQGGNPMSRDPAKGVVDPQFRVYGTENVHVCDASVFPSSITVNPQLTVMALAVCAAREIAGEPRPQPVVSTSQAAASGPGS